MAERKDHRSQIDKFNGSVRDHETDQSEAFDRGLKKVARSDPRKAAARRAVEEAKAARAERMPSDKP
jgi:hypothetical protein